MIKTTGAEFKRFYADWPEDVVLDGESIEVNGVEFDIDLTHELADTVVVRIHDGFLTDDDMTADFGSLAALFRQWRKQQTITTLVCEVPKEREAEIRTWLRQHGVKLRS